MNIFGLLEHVDLTADDFVRLKNMAGAHRICFEESHKNALKPYQGRFQFTFSVPFSNGIKQVFGISTGLHLYPSNHGGWWTGIENEHKKVEVEKWIKSQGSKVYMRDLLDLSICLSMNMAKNQTRTELGELSYKAKYNADEAAIAILADRMASIVAACPVLSNGSAVSPVPPRPGKIFDFPTELAKGVARRLGKPLIESGSWQGDKGQLKAVSYKDKWDTLEKVGFEVSPAARMAKSLILIDDLYQSGSTLNFIGAKLKNASKGEVMGVCAVKSMRDTDNN